MPVVSRCVGRVGECIRRAPSQSHNRTTSQPHNLTHRALPPSHTVQDALRSRGCKLTGKKDDLLERLREHLAANPNESDEYQAPEPLPPVPPTPVAERCENQNDGGITSVKVVPPPAPSATEEEQEQDSATSSATSSPAANDLGPLFKKRVSAEPEPALADVPAPPPTPAAAPAAAVALATAVPAVAKVTKPTGGTIMLPTKSAVRRHEETAAAKGEKEKDKVAAVKKVLAVKIEHKIEEGRPPLGSITSKATDGGLNGQREVAPGAAGAKPAVLKSGPVADANAATASKLTIAAANKLKAPTAASTSVTTATAAGGRWR